MIDRVPTKYQIEQLYIKNCFRLLSNIPLLLWGKHFQKKKKIDIGDILYPTLFDSHIKNCLIYLIYDIIKLINLLFPTFIYIKYCLACLNKL